MRHMRTIAVWGKTTGRIHLISVAMYQTLLSRGIRPKIMDYHKVIPMRGIL